LRNASPYLFAGEVYLTKSMVVHDETSMLFEACFT
jgi:hypothetical protein